jgi:hypothetical protein
MAAKDKICKLKAGNTPLDKVIAEKVVTDWRTWDYSQQNLADKYQISKGVVEKDCLPKNRSKVLSG